MHMEVVKCNEKDINELQEIGYKTFDQTFSDQNTPENLHDYLDKAFNKQQIKKELSHEHSHFFFVYWKHHLAGYLKVNTNDAQSEDMGNQSLEIERIYILREFQRQGLGKLLLGKALEIAKQQNVNNVWLGVWERNSNAISFYEKMGFKQNGTHSFYMGDEKQTDIIMGKSLVP